MECQTEMQTSLYITNGSTFKWFTWIPKLHKNPYMQRYIAGSAKCSTKPLSQILTRILTAVKEGLQKYCDTACARSGVNQMWILKNSKELLENLKAQSLHSVNSIKSFDFSTLYTTIPHDKLKSKLKAIINQCFFHKNGNRRFQYVVIGYKDTYFIRDHSDAPQKYSDADVIKMLEYLIDNILVEFGSSAVGYFNKQSAYRWVLIVHRYLPTCFYTRMKRSLYKVSSKQAKNTSHNNSISLTDI